MVNRDKFFKEVREEFFGGKLTQSNVDGMNAILGAWDSSGENDTRKLAYILATVYHETGKSMYPVEEVGKGRGKPYGKKIKMSGAKYTKPDKIYYGLGYPQLTWYENYDYAGKQIGYDLLNYPELMLVPEISARVLVEGMLEGWFTGKALSKYINDTHIKDKEANALSKMYYNARRVVNGLDRAELIAGYAERFYKIVK